MHTPASFAERNLQYNHDGYNQYYFAFDSTFFEAQLTRPRPGQIFQVEANLLRPRPRPRPGTGRPGG